MGDMFDAEQLAKVPERSSLHVTDHGRFIGRPPSTDRRASQIRQQIERAIAATDYISEEVARYYFGKAREYVAQEIVRLDMAVGKPPYIGPLGQCKLSTCPLFPDNKTRYLALNSVLATIWERARGEWALAVAKSETDTRVPTFKSLEADLARGKRYSRVSPEAVIGAFGTIGRSSANLEALFR